MGLFSFIGWIIGYIFAFAFNRIADIFVWIIPSYMTVHVIKETKSTLYENYLSFWIILALILGLEHITFYFLYYITGYSTLRLCFVIWLQIDYCANAKNIFDKIKPFISTEHEQLVETSLNSVTEKLDEHGGKITEKIKGQFWNIIQQNYELIKDSLFSALTTVSNKAVDINKSAASLSGGEKVDGDKNKDDDNKENNNSEKETIQKKES